MAGVEKYSRAGNPPKRSRLSGEAKSLPGAQPKGFPAQAGRVPRIPTRTTAMIDIE